MSKDIIISIRDVEPGLVAAVKKLSVKLDRELKAIVLVSPGFVYHKDRYIDETGYFELVECDFDDPEHMQKVLKPYLSRILAVTCRFETAIQQFRKVIPFLPYVNTPSETSLLWSIEKSMMRDRLRGYDEALVPKYRLLTELTDVALEKALKGMKYPIIVKPNGLNSSLLVTICDNKYELKTCLNKTFEVIEDVYRRERGAGRPSVLLEEVMQGEMYSIDAYVDASGAIYCLPLVKVITAHSIGLEGFYSYRHIVPTQSTDTDRVAAKKVAEDAVRALNLSSCTAHVEMFKTADGWKIIELGPRIGGYREGLYREAYGIDHYYNDLAVRIGMEPEITDTPISNAAGLNIYAEEEGVIVAIDGLEEARRIPGVVFLKVHAKPGDKALFAGNGGELIVDGILKNDDPRQLEKNVRKVRELIKIRVKTPNRRLVSAVYDA